MISYALIAFAAVMSVATPCFIMKYPMLVPVLMDLLVESASYTAL